MYERFTDRARKVMQLANQEAWRFSHEYIGTEHILLGLVKEGSGVAANVLKNLDIDLRKIRLEVEKLVQCGPDVTKGMLAQTPRVKKVIEYAIEESRGLGHNYVGTEHLLLGLVREQQGVAAQVLKNLGLTLDDVRSEIINLLGYGASAPDMSSPDPSEPETPEVIYFNAEIERLNSEKETALMECDFQRAAELRDQGDRLKKLKYDLITRLRAKDPATAPYRADLERVPNLPELMAVQSAIERVMEERMAAIGKFDAEIRRLKEEQARIIAEWRKKSGRE